MLYMFKLNMTLVILIYSFFISLFLYWEDYSSVRDYSSRDQIRELHLRQEEGIVTSYRKPILTRGVQQGGYNSFKPYRFKVRVPKLIRKITVLSIGISILPLIGIATERFRVLRN